MDLLDDLWERADWPRIGITLAGSLVVCAACLFSILIFLGKRSERSAAAEAEAWFGGSLTWESYAFKPSMTIEIKGLRGSEVGAFGAETQYFSADRLTVRPSLSGLLRGQVKAISAELESPSLRLARSRGGTWRPAFFQGKFADCGEGAAFAGMPTRIHVRNGTLNLDAASAGGGVEIETTAIEGEMSPSPDGSFFSFKLRGETFGSALDLEGRLEPCGDVQAYFKGAAPTLDLDRAFKTAQRLSNVDASNFPWLPGGPAEAEFLISGSWSFLESEGKIRARDADASFSLAGQSLLIHSIAVGVGPSRATGEGRIDFGGEGAPCNFDFQLNDIPIKDLIKRPFGGDFQPEGRLQGTFHFSGALSAGRPKLDYGEFAVTGAILKLPDPRPGFDLAAIGWRSGSTQIRFDRIGGVVRLDGPAANISQFEAKKDGLAIRGEWRLEPLQGAKPEDLFKGDFAFSSTLEIEATNAALQTEPFDAMESPFEGEMTATLKLSGDTVNLENLSAAGELRATDGVMINPWLFKAFRRQAPRREFRELNVSFDANASRLLATSVSFAGPEISFRASGRASYDGQIEAHGAARVGMDVAKSVADWRGYSWWLADLPPETILQGSFSLTGGLARPAFRIDRPTIYRPPVREEPEEPEESMQTEVGEQKTADREPTRTGPIIVGAEGDQKEEKEETGEQFQLEPDAGRPGKPPVTDEDRRMIIELEGLLQEYGIDE